MISDGELVGCVFLKERTIFGEYRPLLWPNNSPAGRKVEEVLIKKSACAEFDSVECSFFLHVAERDLLLLVERTAGAKEMV